MRWLVADTTYNDEARWCGHLDSYAFYLREYGEDVTAIDLRTSPTVDARGWDVVYALDRWADMATIGARLRVAQTAADVRPYPWECREASGAPSYGLVMSAVPWMVEAATAAGCNAHLVPLAFDARARTAGMGVERDLGLIHIGTIGASHRKRAEVVATLGPGLITLKMAFGRAYFAALARARTVLNVHAEWSRGAVINMRVYEALGMGCDMLADGTPPDWLREFEINSSVVGVRAYSGTAAAHVLECETYVERVPQILRLVREATS